MPKSNLFAAMIVIFSAIAASFILAAGASRETTSSDIAVSTSVVHSTHHGSMHTDGQTTIDLAQEQQVDAQFTSFKIDLVNADVALYGAVNSSENGICLLNYAPLEGDAGENRSIEFTASKDQESGNSFCQTSIPQSEFLPNLYYFELEYASTETDLVGISEGRIFDNQQY